MKVTEFNPSEEFNELSPAEPKCADCGDADHVGRECGATKFAGDEIGVCRCYRPAEPDATERVNNVQQALSFLEKFNHRELNTYEWMADFLESETPRIKADAVREFVEEIKNRYGNNDLGLFVYGCAKNLAKEMTEEV